MQLRKKITDPETIKSTVQKDLSEPEKINEITHLVAMGHDINETDVLGFTALHWAAYSNEPELVSALIRLGANVNLIGDRRATPLINAARSRQENTSKIIDILCSNRADVNFLSLEGTPLDHAVDTKYASRNKGVKVEIVNTLIKHKASVDSAIAELMDSDCMLYDDHISILKILFKYTIDPFKISNWLYVNGIGAYIHSNIRYHPELIDPIIDAISAVESLEKRAALYNEIIQTCEAKKNKDIKNVDLFKQAVLKALYELITLIKEKKSAEVSQRLNLPERGGVVKVISDYVDSEDRITISDFVIFSSASMFKKSKPTPADCSISKVPASAIASTRIVKPYRSA